MEEKAVCYYCATVYPAEQEKCPLCGSTKREENYVVPQRRERETEAERKQRTKGGLYASNKKKPNTAKAVSGEREEKSNPKPMYIAALVFLSLAVLVLFWFIADMIGWIPGFENGVDRETQPSVSVNVGCTELLAEPTRLDFTKVGQKLELTLSVNSTCEETLYCISEDTVIITVSEEGVTQEGEEQKSVTFTLTAMAEGTTSITATCGNQTMAIPVTVIHREDTEETGNPTTGNVAPEVNIMEVRLEEVGETCQLKVTNLPEGTEVTWTSLDEAIVTVDAQGLVTALGEGETFIHCTANGETTEIKVTSAGVGDVSNPTGAHLETTDASVKVGESFPLFLYDSEGEHIDEITYVVDNTAICQVNNNRVKALAKGTTNVRVIFGDQEFVCVVRVKG